MCRLQKMSCSETRQWYDCAIDPVQPHSPFPLSSALLSGWAGRRCCRNSQYSLVMRRAEVHGVGREKRGAVKLADTSCMQKSSIPGMAAQQLSQLNNKRHKRKTEIREIEAKSTREIGRLSFLVNICRCFLLSAMLQSNLPLLWVLWMLNKINSIPGKTRTLLFSNSWPVFLRCCCFLKIYSLESHFELHRGFILAINQCPAMALWEGWSFYDNLSHSLGFRCH